MMEWLGGLDPASPIPTPIRASSKWMKFWARPQAAVIALQRASEIEMILTRFIRSASAATGIPSVA